MRLNKIIKEDIEFNLYCDLDGVLVNLEKGIKELTGFNPGEISNNKMWKAVFDPSHNVVDWWTNLEWQPGGKEIWEHIKEFNPTILTGLPRGEKGEIAAEGKRGWCKKNLGSNVPVITTMGRLKQEYANENSILIDDRLDLIEQWKEKNGIAFHVVDPKKTLEELKSFLFN